MKMYKSKNINKLQSPWSPTNQCLQSYKIKTDYHFELIIRLDETHKGLGFGDYKEWCCGSSWDQQIQISKTASLLRNKYKHPTFTKQKNTEPNSLTINFGEINYSKPLKKEGEGMARHRMLFANVHKWKLGKQHSLEWIIKLEDIFCDGLLKR